MAWTAPMTAVAGSVFTAAQFNTFVRDNLNETAPALASAASQLFVSTGVNSIAARTPTEASVATAQSNSTGTYVDLATVGPAVTVTTGPAAIIFTAADMSSATVDIISVFSYAISGATTVAASDTWRTAKGGMPGGDRMRASGIHMRTDLTPGSNTFTMKYLSAAGFTSTWRDRHIAVLPL